MTWRRNNEPPRKETRVSLLALAMKKKKKVYNVATVQVQINLFCIFHLSLFLLAINYKDMTGLFDIPRLFFH
jgi:hypothetical protein